MNYILNEAGDPELCDEILRWAAWFETSADARRVAGTDVGTARVSTVFLGIDHAFGDGPPILYETMVFGGPMDQTQDRYHTKEEALAGHEAMVERVKASQ